VIVNVVDVVDVVVVVVVGGTVVVVVVVVVGGTVVVVVVVGGGGGAVVVVVVVGGGGGGVVVVVVGGGGTVVAVVVGGAAGLDEVVVVTGATGEPKVKGRLMKDGRAVVGPRALVLALVAWEMRKGNGDASVVVVGVVVGVVDGLVGAVEGVVPVTKGRPLWSGDVVADAEVLALDPLPIRRALTAATITTPATTIDQRQNVSSPLTSSTTVTPHLLHDF
jgi:hypothetical protein